MAHFTMKTPSKYPKLEPAGSNGAGVDYYKMENILITIEQLTCIKIAGEVYPYPKTEADFEKLIRDKVGEAL